MGCKEIKICQRLNSCLSLGGIPYYMCKYIPMVVNPQLISILILLIVSTFMLFAMIQGLYIIKRNDEEEMGVAED